MSETCHTLAIFGTGSSGARAWETCTAIPSVKVVAFADNDARKHGTLVHGLPVLSAEELVSSSIDGVVLASMFAADIRTQLLSLGLAHERIVAESDSHCASAVMDWALARTPELIALEDGIMIARETLPRILFLSYESLDNTHGTGVLLQRMFRGFPRENLFAVSVASTGGSPWLENQILLPGDVSESECTRLLQQALQERTFSPQIVYSTAFNENDLRLLRIALESVECSTPVVQHFMDMAPHDAREFANGFRRLNSRVSELWALTESMGRELEQMFARQVQVVSALHQDLPQSSKTRHVRFSSTFKAVMIGNIWQPQLLPLLREVWCQCQADLPSLRPIDWYIHPARVQKLIEGGYELGDEIVWKGFYDGLHLQQRLQSADLALLPFNWGNKAQSGYARFSLPSRLTEYCAAGLPVVAFASPDTAPAQFMNNRGCGVAISGSNPSQVAQTLKQMIVDHEWRARAGTQARRLSEDEFSLGPFTQWLRTRLMKIVEQSTPK